MAESYLKPSEAAGILRANYFPRKFRVLSKKQLRNYMQVTDRITFCGVYFLWNGEELAYIGSSLNIKKRVASHAKQQRIAFDYASCLTINFPWHLSVEAAYIDAYMPTWNKRHAPTGIARELMDKMSDLHDKSARV